MLMVLNLYDLNVDCGYVITYSGRLKLLVSSLGTRLMDDWSKKCATFVSAEDQGWLKQHLSCFQPIYRWMDGSDLNVTTSHILPFGNEKSPTLNM